MLLVLLAVALLLVPGCSSVWVNTDYDRTVNFAELSSYDWLEGPRPPTGDPRLDSSLLDERIHRAVDEALAAGGYVLRTDGTPDFRVTYHVALQDKMAYSEHYTYARAWRYGGGPSVDVYEYDEGTLILDLVDPTGERLLWRGTARGVADPGVSPDEKEERIREAVEAILAEFPPA